MTLDHDTLFKALDGTISPVAGYRYPVGRWTKHLDPGTLVPCRVGYHLARGPMVLQHLDTDLYLAESCPEHGLVELDGQLATCRTRLTRVSAWDERTARLFAADCAEAVLLGEQARGAEPDGRLWAAVAAARRHADGLVGDYELAVAEDGAQSAATRATAWAAARAAAKAAAGAAAGAAIGVAAWAATAARDAAQSATDAARAAAKAAAQSTMFDRLALYLNEQPLPPVEALYGPAMEVVVAP